MTKDPRVQARLTRVRHSGPMTPDDPRHGTDTGYAAGCREDCCRQGHTRRRKIEHLYPNPLVDCTGTRRRVQALARLGWSESELSRRLGRHKSFMRKVIANDRIQSETAAIVAALYDELSMTWCTTSTANNTAAKARAAGWAAPLAWDDHAIDDPTAEPYCKPTEPDDDEPELDPVTVDRILCGEWRLPATPTERREVARRWHTGGGSLEELARRTGWKVDRYYKASEAAA